MRQSRPGLFSPSGRVQLRPPTASSPYWRAIYRDDFGRRRQTKGGRTWESAFAKAEEIERRLSTPFERVALARTFNDLIDDYVDPARPKFLNAKQRHNQQWSTGYAEQVDLRLARIRPALGHLRLSELRQRHVHELVNSQHTYTQAVAVRVLIAAIVNFGADRQYLRADQRAVARVDVLVRSSPRPPRRRELREQGEGAGVVSDADVPTDRQVHDLSRAEVQYRQWEGLVNTLAYAGPRIHEALALAADDVVPGDRSGVAGATVLAIHSQITEPKGGGITVTAPKNRRRRQTVVPEATPNGFALASWLRVRAEEARAERVAGTNPRALLFPNSRGDYWRLRNLRRRLFCPAAIQAGWSHQTFHAPATYRVKGRSVTRVRAYVQWDHTLHSLRHRFATTARDDWHWTGSELCRSGGWASEAFVLQHYYGTSRDVLITAAAKQQLAACRALPVANGRPALADGVTA